MNLSTAAVVSVELFLLADFCREAATIVSNELLPD